MYICIYIYICRYGMTRESWHWPSADTNDMYSSSCIYIYDTYPPPHMYMQVWYDKRGLALAFRYPPPHMTCMYPPPHMDFGDPVSGILLP